MIAEEPAVSRSHGYWQTAQSASETGTLASLRVSARLAYCFARTCESCEAGGGDGALDGLRDEKAEVSLPIIFTERDMCKMVECGDDPQLRWAICVVSDI